MAQSNFITSSIGKKFFMAITGFFLMVFLLVHLSVNLSLFGGKQVFNEASHFMATNPLIQISQYILAVGFIAHIFFGVKLYLQNKNARGGINYAVNQWKSHTPFNARTMIYTGLLVLCFLVLHLKDFTIPMKIGHTQGLTDYEFVTEHFKNPIYTTIYVIAFISLAIHLSYGFQSSFQSIGVRHKNYTPFIKKLSILYFWFISLGFSSIALWFFLKQ